MCDHPMRVLQEAPLETSIHRDFLENTDNKKMEASYKYGAFQGAFWGFL